MSPLVPSVPRMSGCHFIAGEGRAMYSTMPLARVYSDASQRTHRIYICDFIDTLHSHAFSRVTVRAEPPLREVWSIRPSRT